MRDRRAQCALPFEKARPQITKAWTQTRMASALWPVMWTAASEGLPVPDGCPIIEAAKTLRLLQVAVWNDHGETVRHLLSKCLAHHFDTRLLVNEDVPGSHCTWLAYAASRGSCNTAAALLQAKAHVDEFSAQRCWPLEQAARHGHLEVLQLLLRADADVHLADDRGITPLMQAADSGDCACVRALLEAKAEVDVCDVDGQTALCYAADEGRAAAVRVLLDAKACVDGGADVSWSPLCGAAAYDHVAALCVLLEANANMDLRDRQYDYTPLDQAVLTDNQVLVSLLLAAKSDAGSADGQGETPLCRALADGNRTIAALLRNATG